MMYCACGPRSSAVGTQSANTALSIGTKAAMVREIFDCEASWNLASSCCT